jgi:hypothetical protein
MRTIMIAAAGRVFAFVGPTLADITIQTAKIAQGEVMIIGTVPRGAPGLAAFGLPPVHGEQQLPTAGLLTSTAT